MITNNPTQAISRVRHRDKYKCVSMCREKENQGFECIRPIEYMDYDTKDFRKSRNGMEYTGFRAYGFYEAIYRKKFEG